VLAHLLTVTQTCHYVEDLDVAVPVLAEPIRPMDGTIQAPAQRPTTSQFQTPVLPKRSWKCICIGHERIMTVAAM
jgi:hypothetical protein